MKGDGSWEFGETNIGRTKTRAEKEAVSLIHSIAVAIFGHGTCCKVVTDDNKQVFT